MFTGMNKFKEEQNKHPPAFCVIYKVTNLFGTSHQPVSDHSSPSLHR